MQRSFPKYAIAASLAVLAIGVPATLHVMRSDGERQMPQPVPVPPLVATGPAQGSPKPDAAPEPRRVTVLPVTPPPASDPAQNLKAMRDLAAKLAAPRERAVATARPNAALSAHPQTFARNDGLRVATTRAPAGYQQAAGQWERRELMPAPAPSAEEGRDRFQSVASNPIKRVAEEPVSTFSIDVDTSAYSFVRRSLMAGRLPPRDAVRVEEMINYFPYDYAVPKDRAAPFAPAVTVMPSPWNPANRLVHVAIKGYDIVPAERPRANLVFLIDTSGSMAGEDRLPLLRNSLRLLVDNLKPDDTIGIVTYAGQAQAALEPTRVSDKAKILTAIEQLQAGGSTAGGAGIEIAYRMAEASFDKNAVNRVVLGTDGDFNVGITDREQLKGFVERKRQSGIFLSILGFGRGNYNDALMQALAQNGNGTAAYIDTLNEARKVLADEASSTLFPIAKDVKIQVEFNPAAVSEYRLIGYETRALRREDFNNDKVDAGEIGAGHAVTAIYEIVPAGAPASVDTLRYQQAKAQPVSSPAPNGELAFVKLRYKLPKEETSRLIELPVRVADAVELGQATTEVRFSAAVAAFGQLLRGDPYLKSFGHDEIVALANGAKGGDPFGYRAEFVNLVRLAKSAKP